MNPGRDDLIWGIHPVLELLQHRPRQVAEIWVQKGKSSPRLQEIIDLARRHNLKLRFEGRLRVPGAAAANHQGVVARLAAVAAVDLDTLLAGLGRGGRPALLVALDSIQDPHNLGAIIRSAAAAGADGVIIPKDRSAPLTGTTAKVAAGAASRLPVCVVTNLAVSLQRLKEEGIWVYGAAGEAAPSLYATDLCGPVCLVIGSEGKGLRPLVREQCDGLLAIPMPGGLESLNAAAAATVILFEAVRQRLAASS